MNRKEFEKQVDGFYEKFLVEATHSPDEIFEMPDGPVKKKIDYMIQQCRNCPESAIALLLMSLGDCYCAIAKMEDVDNQNALQYFVEQQSPINNIAYRFVKNFQELRDK